MTSINSLTSASLFQTTSTTSDKDTRAAKALAGVSDLLGLSVEELNLAQKNGVTLGDIADGEGVSRDDLQEALAKGLEENKPDGVTDDTDFEAMAKKIIDGTYGQDDDTDSTSTNWWDTSDSATSPDRISALLSQYNVSSKTLMDYLNEGSSSDSGSLFDMGNTDSQNDFAAQLQTLMDKYGSKGNSYDSKA